MNTETTYNADGTVTLWNVYTQQWETGSDFSDRVYASLASEERDRVIAHIERAGRADLVEQWWAARKRGFSVGQSIDNVCAFSGARRGDVIEALRAEGLTR
jgi:hypothetical protein